MRCKECHKEDVELVRAPGDSRIFYKKVLVPEGKKPKIAKRATVVLYPFIEAEDGLCYYCHKKSIGLFNGLGGQSYERRLYRTMPLREPLKPEVARWLENKRSGVLRNTMS